MINCLLSLNRTALRRLVQVIIGHNVLNKHLHTAGVRDSPLCSMCNKEAETSAHFVGACDVYALSRLHCLGAPILTIQDFVESFELTDLLRFIRESGRFSADLENPQFSGH
jgi:hypothetical protein